MNEKKYYEAISAFEAMDGFKDSVAKIEECKPLAITNPVVGKIVWFGSYEQDNNISNGKESIEWLVLAKDGNRILVTSKYALDCKKYNTEWVDVTWETCTLRKWLNNDFLNAAFSEKEKAKILTVTVSAAKNPEYSTNSGNATQDKVFLLSGEETEEYFITDKARRCAPTPYAIAQGADTSNDFTLEGKASCWLWLRSPGNVQDSAASLTYDGSVSYYGDYVVLDDVSVRPAMWISLDA